MWPAMWASAFYDDDVQNGVLADEMGIVMGTSHHEPMGLAQQDWKRRGTGALGLYPKCHRTPGFLDKRNGTL